MPEENIFEQLPIESQINTITNFVRLNRFVSYRANSTTVESFVFDTSPTLSTAGAELLSIKNAGTEKFALDKDGKLTLQSALLTNIISERTSATGVTIDGVLLKDNEVTTDTINEKTAGSGITLDGVLLKDGEGEFNDHIRGTTGNGYLNLLGDSGASNGIKIYDTGIITQAGQPSVRAYLTTTNQTINSGASTTVTLNAESYDIGSNFASNTFTVPTNGDGKYLIVGQVYWSADFGAGDIVETVIWVTPSGGTLTTMSHDTQEIHDGSAGQTTRIMDILDLGAGDTVVLRVKHDNASAQDIEFGEFKTFLCITKIT